MMDKGMTRWKSLISLTAIVVVVAAGIGFVVGQPQARKEFIGKTDPVSGYRCRFTVSTYWKPDPFRWCSKTDFEHSFVLTSSPIQLWIERHLMHTFTDKEIPHIYLAELPTDETSNASTLVDGYPEVMTAGMRRLISHRHLTIDGCPSTIATYETTEMPGGLSSRTMVLLVHGSTSAVVWGMAETEKFASVEEEMQAIISSFHVEKMRVPPGEKR